MAVVETATADSEDGISASSQWRTTTAGSVGPVNVPGHSRSTNHPSGWSSTTSSPRTLVPACCQVSFVNRSRQ